MTERLNNTSHPTPSIEVVMSAYDRLQRLIEEHGEGGLVDQTRDKLHERYQDAMRSLKKTEQALEEHKAEIETIDNAIEQIVNDFAAMLRNGKQPSTNIEVRTVIQTERRGYLQAEIVKLTDQLEALKEYISRNRNNEHLLATRANAIAVAIGSFATACAETEDVIDVMPVPPLFGQTYRYQPIIADNDLSTFTQLSKAQQSTISVPLNIAPPPKIDYPEETLIVEVQPEPELRKAPLNVKTGIFASPVKRGIKR